MIARSDFVGAEPAGGELAARMVSVARAYAGTGASREPDRYLELLMGPGDTDRAYFLAASSCGLFARGVMRRAGVDHPILRSPYRVGRAISDVLEIARSKGAFVDAGGPQGPQPRAGDITWIKTPGDNDDHVEIVTEVLGPWRFQAAAGGQGAGGTESGLFERSPWRIDGSRFYAGNRTVMGWVDAHALANPTRAAAPVAPSPRTPGAPVPAAPSAPAKRPGSGGLVLVFGGLLVFSVGASLAGGWRGR